MDFHTRTVGHGGRYQWIIALVGHFKPLLGGEELPVVCMVVTPQVEMLHTNILCGEAAYRFSW